MIGDKQLLDNSSTGLHEFRHNTIVLGAGHLILDAVSVLRYYIPFRIIKPVAHKKRIVYNLNAGLDIRIGKVKGDML